MNGSRWSAGLVCLVCLVCTVCLGVFASACSGARPDLVDVAATTSAAPCSGPTPGLHEVTIDGGCDGAVPMAFVEAVGGGHAWPRADGVPPFALDATLDGGALLAAFTLPP